MAGSLELALKLNSALHQKLLTLNHIAKFLSVTPRLPHHPITSKSVSVALTTLLEFGVASVVSEGVDLLRDHKNSIDGPGLAREFLEKYLSKHVKDIGASFWEEFAMLSQDGTAKKQIAKVEVHQPSPAKSATTESSTRTPGIARSSSSTFLSTAALPGNDNDGQAEPVEPATPKVKKLRRL